MSRNWENKFPFIIDVNLIDILSIKPKNSYISSQNNIHCTFYLLGRFLLDLLENILSCSIVLDADSLSSRLILLFLKVTLIKEVI